MEKEIDEYKGTIERLKGVSRGIENRRKDVDLTLQAKLVMLKSQYGKLKHNVIELMSRLLFIEGLQTGTWQTQDHADAALKKTCSDLRLVKEEVNLLKSSLKDMAVKTETYSDINNTKLQHLEKVVSVL